MGANLSGVRLWGLDPPPATSVASLMQHAPNCTVCTVWHLVPALCVNELSHRASKHLLPSIVFAADEYELLRPTSCRVPARRPLFVVFMITRRAHFPTKSADPFLPIKTHESRTLSLSRRDSDWQLD